jgi:hypothetical protein
MKKNEISAKFNAILADAISDGFYPCMTELTGSYSDVMGSQIVLAKCNERMVLWMEERMSFGHRDEVSSVTLYASRFTLKSGETTEWDYRWSTQWKEHIVWSETVYQVSEGRHNDDAWYSEEKDDAEKARRLRTDRWHDGFMSGRRDYEVTDQLMRIVRKVKGFKSVARKNVKVWKWNGVWHIENTASHNIVALSA